MNLQVKKVDNKKDVKNIHSGHRQRMREKAYKNGFDSFEQHELLEMLLYATVPQKDTNPIAHNLINSFGSFHAVFEAPVEELMKVSGMTKTSAFLLKMIPEISSEYLYDKVSGENNYIKTSEEAYNYIAPKYIGKTNEIIYVLFMNTAGKLISFEMLDKGSLNFANIDSRKLVSLCLKHNAAGIIICHNHPSGNATPSSNDMITTKNIRICVNSISVKLLDHLIITDKGYTSMREMKQYENLFN